MVDKAGTSDKNPGYAHRDEDGQDKMMKMTDGCAQQQQEQLQASCQPPPATHSLQHRRAGR